MATIKTFIDIHATPETVWRVLTDFSAYAKWNPFIRDASGNAREKQRLRLTMQLPHGGTHRFSPRIVRAIPAAELRWRGKLLIDGLFDGEHTFIIVPHGLKGVRLIQREKFSGLLAPLILLFVQKKTTEGFQLMNRALKKVAEAKH